jgi:hypothetical protein
LNTLHTINNIATPEVDNPAIFNKSVSSIFFFYQDKNQCLPRKRRHPKKTGKQVPLRNAPMKKPVRERRKPANVSLPSPVNRKLKPKPRRLSCLWAFFKPLAVSRLLTPKRNPKKRRRRKR